MTDVLTEAQRRFVMSRIRQRDTNPEMVVRRGLHALGFRFRLQDRRLPGRPDLVFARYRVAVFVHGCFWHAHGCHLSKMPETRKEFWETKLGANAARDGKAIASLQAAGWRVLVIWECAMRGVKRLEEAEMLGLAANFISEGSMPFLEVPAVSAVGCAGSN
jgi:DNA mismatch endonuclease (patch repair protein)